MDAIGTALISASVKEGGGPFAALLKSIGNEAFDALTAQFEGCFQGHIDATYLRCSKIKNILYRDQSVNFRSQYVNIMLSSMHQEVTDHEALYAAIAGGRILLCGTAGAGKTMFLRWSALELIETMNVNGRIPLYLEMRYLEDSIEQEALESYIFRQTSAASESSRFGQFLSGLRHGLFVVILDAIDEIKPELRDCFVQKLLKFLSDYPSCGMVVSSRFDEKLESVQDFSILRTMPMNEQQIIAVLDKLDYDTEVKAKLIGRLQGGLYAALRQFLSNPLLATIMLLSFDHSADIPTKLTLFYQQAFEALYQRHDAAKGAYKRAHYAGLPLDRFQDIFSTFCFQTYVNYKFEFSDSELLSAFREACTYNQEAADPRLIVRDTMESVCLIQRDGLDNVFSHRSFQEYFCAVFISKYREDNVGKLIDSIMVMENRSNVLGMLYEMAPEVIDYDWLLPHLSEFILQTQDLSLDTADGLHAMFSHLFPQVVVDLTDNCIDGWVSHVTSASGHQYAAPWMGAAKVATQGIVRLLDPIFSPALWDDFDEFQNKIPSEHRPANVKKINRVTGRKVNDQGVRRESVEAVRRKVIRLAPSDAQWLIYSNLPRNMDAVRALAQSCHAEITRRRSGRRQSVETLLVRARR